MKYLIALLLILCSSVFAAESTGSITSASLSPMSYTGAYLPNPSKGPLSDTGYNDIIGNWQSGAPVTAGMAAGKRMGHCMFNLAAYRTSAIAGSWLTTFQSRMDSMRSAGMKCVIRFYYDNYDGSGVDTTADWMVSHMAQLKPYLWANADVIAYAYGGLIGAFGEQHSSTNCNAYITNPDKALAGCTQAIAAANRIKIRDALFSALHPSTFLLWRFPADFGIWYPTALNASTAFTGSPQSRISTQNDAMLSGNNDTYTFTDFYNTGFSTASQKAYVSNIGRYAPYGGEMANNGSAPQRITCAEARTDFASYRITFLKDSGGDSNWRNQWAAEGCVNELNNRMGYFLQVISVSHQATASAGQSITVKADLQNVGWGRVFGKYRLVAKACLVASPNTCYTGTASTLLQQLESQASSTSRVEAKIQIPVGATTGAYRIRLSAPDQWPALYEVRPYSIRFANNNDAFSTWSDATGYLELTPSGAYSGFTVN